MFSAINKFKNFSIVGIIVTIISLITSFFFLKIIGTPLLITYIINYVGTILLSYLLNAYFVFKRKFNVKHLCLFFLSYLIGMLFGVILLKIFEKLFTFENWILSYMVIPFTMMSNFIFANKIFKRGTDEK